MQWTTFSAFGVKTVPVVARGGELVFAQALEDVSRFIGRDFHAERLAPDELVKRWLRIPTAAQRHVLQVPAAKLWSARCRAAIAASATSPTTCTQVPDAFLQAVENGVENLTAVYNAPPPREVVSAEHIQEYGKSVAARIEKWWTALADKSCRQTVNTYYGARPLHELLERCTWHSAQHARQMIAVLERLGVKPQAPLTGADYAGLPMPKGLWE